MSSEVLVLGGGILGVSVADSLAGAGMRVRLLEGEGLASGASGAAAGMLAPISEADTTGPLLALGLESLDRNAKLCARLKDETGLDPEFEASGLLRLAAGEPEAEAFSQLASRGGELGLEWIDAETLRRQEPTLGEGIQGAIYSPREGHLRPPLLVQARAESARRRGVEIETGVRALALRFEGDRVVGVETNAGSRHGVHVVVALGPWTPGLLSASGLSLGTTASPLMRPVRGQILALNAPLPATREIVWGEGIYFVPKRDGSWIVGATEEEVGFDRRVTAAGIAWLLERARRAFPSLAEAEFSRAWAGLRPVSSDRLPWIGHVPSVRGLSLAAGHGRNGVLLAARTADLIRDELMGKSLPDRYAGFSPGRVG